MKLKILPLPNWLVLGLKYDYDSDLHRVLGKKISPIFNREGYYYDRQTRKCWIEIDGFGAFEYNSYQFLDDLYYFSRSERRLNDLELQAIKTLAQSRLASKRQLELMRAEIQIRNLRNISVSSRLMVAKVLKNKS